MKKRLVSLALAAAMVFTMLTGCASGKVDGSQAAAEVGGEEISLAVANFYARHQQAQYEAYYSSYLGEDMWSGDAATGMNYEQSVKSGVMNDLQIMYVLRQHANEYDVALSDEEMAAITEAASEFLESNDLEAKEALMADQETVEEVLSLLTIQQKMYEQMVVDVDREVSDEEAAQKSMEYVFVSYQKTNDEGVAEDMTAEEKEAVLKEMEEFTSLDDFTALAEEKGYTVSTATFDSESTVPAESVIKAADELKEGEVSAVIDDELGAYVVKLTSLLDRAATDAEKETIIETREYEQYTELCEVWLEGANPKVHSRVWDTVDFEKLGVTIKDTTVEE